MNHKRCCANDRGKSISLLTRLIGGAWPPLSACLSCSTASAIPATVGFSKTTLKGTSTFNTSLTRETTCVASSECPPSSKKFSSSLTLSLFNTSSQIPATSSLTGVCSLSFGLSSSSLTGSGNARRSSFPFAVSGSSVSSTQSCGHIYSGSLSARYFFNPSSPATFSSLLTT